VRAVIAGVGAAVPERVVGNDAFAHLGVDDTWIRRRTGIGQRRLLAAEDRLADLAVDAAREALSDAACDPADVDLVVVATSTADRISPGVAPEVGHLIGAHAPAVVDINAACTGFLYGLDYAMARMSVSPGGCALVIGAEAMSRFTDPDDVTTAVVFGDGAGAVVLRPCEGTPELPLSFGSAGEYLSMIEALRTDQVVRMDGGEVYRFAIDAMAEQLDKACRAAGLCPADLDLLICHQANIKILRSVARRLAYPLDRVGVYLDRFGNTSSASIPIALRHAQQEGRLRPGARVGLAAFGAGLTWGAGIVTWKSTEDPS
jgi:3-oxoacyl-[acyl-carrier-protein] synthase-3